MVRLYRRYEDKDYRTEAKQVGTLYHVCTLDAFVNRIIEDKELGTKDNLHASGKYHNSLLDTYEAVSFTRDSLFVVPTWTVQGADILFQFVVDGDKLSEHYKITPYNGNGTNPRKREKEEVVIGPIKDFKSYIKEVRFDVKALFFGDIEDVISNLKKVKEYLGSIHCKRTTLPFIQKNWSIDYKKSSEEDKLYKVKTLDDLITLLKNFVNIDIRDYVDSKDLFNKYMGWLSDSQINEILKKHPEWINLDALSGLMAKAIGQGSLPIVKICVKHGFDLNKAYTELNDYTPIVYASLQSEWKIVQYLLDNGANPDPNLDGRCLGRAIEDAQDDIVKSMFEHGMVLERNIETLISNNIFSCVHNTESASTNILKILVENGLDANLKYEQKSLIFEAYDGDYKDNCNYDKMELLLKHGADPNSKDKDGNTILGYILKSKEKYNNKVFKYEFVELLLKYNADVNMKSNGDYPIMLSDDLSGSFELLLKYGADVNNRDESGNTAFMRLFYYSISTRAIKSSLEHGVDINAQNKDGETALMLAICETLSYSSTSWISDTQQIELLLKNGADPNIKTSRGYSALDYAIFSDRKDVIRLLIKYGVDITNISSSRQKNYMDRFLAEEQPEKKEESLNIRRLYRR